MATISLGDVEVETFDTLPQVVFTDLDVSTGFEAAQVRFADLSVESINGTEIHLRFHDFEVATALGAILLSFTDLEAETDLATEPPVFESIPGWVYLRLVGGEWVTQYVRFGGSS